MRFKKTYKSALLKSTSRLDDNCHQVSAQAKVKKNEEVNHYDQP
jgi:hypothetical protein